MLNFLNNIGPVEIVVIVGILTLFFGSKVVKGLARSSGETLKEIKNIGKNISEPLESSSKSEKKEAD